MSCGVFCLLARSTSESVSVFLRWFFVLCTLDWTIYMWTGVACMNVFCNSSLL